MADTNQVNMRYPKILLARIDIAAGKESRTKWILEACRTRLDGKWASGETADAGDLKSLSLGSDGSSPSSPTKSGDSSTVEQAAHNCSVEGSNPSPRTTLDYDESGLVDKILRSKPDMQELRDIAAGKIAAYVPISADSYIKAGLLEIPICGKELWEDGVGYECLMDKGHKNPKHCQGGMVRRVDA